jgi:hypothetical protein
MVTDFPPATRAGMRRTVGEVRRGATTRPSMLVDRMSIPPPARAGRGAAAHNRNTMSETGRSGVKTIRSVPVTVPPEKDTVADSRGRWASGSAYDGGQATAASGVGETTVAAADAVPATADGEVIEGAEDTVDVLAGRGELADGGLDEPLQAAHSAASCTATTSRGMRTCRR